MMISINGLSKVFGNNVALREINLKMKKSEFMALFGPNGAGKTTLIKIMSTLIAPTSGAVVIDGYDIREEAIEIRKRIGVISHETYLYEDLSAQENLQFYGRMYEVDDIEERVSDVMSEVGLSPRADDLVRTFSRGMKQRLSIARAILHDPPILLLDEPYTGLDPHAVATFDRILEKSDISNKTVVMTTHMIGRGIEMSDRVAILRSGEIVYDVPRGQIRDEKHFKSIYESCIGEEL
ncbi:MAG: ABC transporter ATP-binding protein [Methanocellales archaeon]|nr:ABC transporter ATP-binding protein [Methanocellales archaeon]